MMDDLDKRIFTVTLYNIDKRINAVIERVPGGEPVPLEYLQKRVDGWIEHINPAYYFADLNISHLPIDLWCNDEGRLLHLTPTMPITHKGEIIDLICGPVIFTSVDESIGETYGLTLDEMLYLIDRLKTYFKKYLQHNITVSEE